jgi:hypothetical protein
MRLSSMLLMLACLYMLWDWARKPGTWQWLAGDPNAAASSPAGPEIPTTAKSEPAKQAIPTSALPPAGEEQGVRAAGIATASKPIAASQVNPPATGTVAGAVAPTKAAAQPPQNEPAEEPDAPATDEDPEERSAIAYEFQAITDNKLEIQPEEQFAYGRVLQWVVNQPASALRKRARTDVTFNDLMLAPDKYRGALVEIVLNARLVRDCRKDAPDGSRLHEVWGFTSDSGAWLYDTIVVGLPKGFPVGAGGQTEEQVRFVGYFFKLQGYHAGGAKPNDPPLSAPVLIGRLIWIQAVAPATAGGDYSWGWILLAVLGALIVLQTAWLLLRPKHRKSAIRPLANLGPGAPTIDEWFDRAQPNAASSIGEPKSLASDRRPPEAQAGPGVDDPSASPAVFGRLDDDQKGDG